MTTISLFHKPTFDDKLYAITVPAYRNALLAAMFAFAARWIRNGSRDQAHPEQPQCSPQEYFDLAMRLLHTALEECSPDEPPLCLLQAMVLTTFYQLIEGVRGKAWRYLGTCIRIAYELRLSTLDSDRAVLRDTAMIPTDISGWVADEERRRVWWALWEFDTLRRVFRKLLRLLMLPAMKHSCPLTTRTGSINGQRGVACSNAIPSNVEVPTVQWKSIREGMVYCNQLIHEECSAIVQTVGFISIERHKPNKSPSFSSAW